MSCLSEGILDSEWGEELLEKMARESEMTLTPLMLIFAYFECLFWIT
jgi:hypothetical protein